MSEEDVLEIIDAGLLRPFKYPRLVYQGFLFHYHKKCKRHIRWKCSRVSKANCQAVLRTTLDMNRPRLIQFDHEHLHEKDTHSIDRLKMKIQDMVIRLSSSFY
ncbi:unnamed protein product [Macrosiphum euphorbiae]|uniref:FLYWCH-type domain-containing protein n=1 Tax=Macrosiphum euphorbiae TaxID=13131 RepID=A0AAV0X0Y5_9HEMI|nr:unnamed protein product [Macrosiphum euphorbiae]